MGFYGVAAVLISAYLWLIIALDVGGGYNEFNKKEDRVRVVRYGFFWQKIGGLKSSGPWKMSLPFAWRLRKA